MSNMTTLEDHVSQEPVADDHHSTYNSDDAQLRDSPLLKPMRPRLEPSLSPPIGIPYPQVSSDSSSSSSSEDSGGDPQVRKAARRRRRRRRPIKVRPSQGDAVLVSFMDGGKHPEIAFNAGLRPLASDEEQSESEDSIDGPEVMVGNVNQVPECEHEGSAPLDNGEGKEQKQGETEHGYQVRKDKEVVVEDNRSDSSHVTGVDLTALAAHALAAHQAHHSQRKSYNLGGITTIQDESARKEADRLCRESQQHTGMEGIIQSHMSSVDNVQTTQRSVIASSPDLKANPESLPGAGELPPIQALSPQTGGDGNGTKQITLPGLRDQLGDISHLGDQSLNGDSPLPFPQSAQVRPPPRFSTVSVAGSVTSPTPLSPSDTLRRELPSPGRAIAGPGNSFFPSSHYRRASNPDGYPYPNAVEYNNSNTETTNTDQSASVSAMAVDRMSIDGITNPQIGGFQCTYPGCTAQPFQTQYLLSSHANVHSSARPHYCHVKGCPRGEGGKGFKRKNEMIRHGLVHESPGYICPFCPDREHKYPRPDNLQRHVRVHHVDKDKEDPQLREVLAQRPEGPSRRRRRGGTS